MNELRHQLWDFVYGLLDEADAARLRERITSDRGVAREYARVKLQSELLAQAARANPTERELPALSERPRIAAASRMSAARLVVFGGSLALSLGLLLFAGIAYWWDGAALRGPAVAQALEDFEKEKHPRLMVVGPQALQPEGSNTYEITVQSLDGKSLIAPVEASLEDFDGNKLWYESALTDQDGKQSVEIPADKLRGEAVRLTIKVKEDATRDQEGTDGALVTWLPIQQQQRELALVHQLSDGKRVYFREAEIRAHDWSELSDAVDKVDKRSASRSESVQRHKKSPAEDRVTLTEEANRVRLGSESLAESGVGAKASDQPLDDATGKSTSGDRVKQRYEALPGLKSTPERMPAPSAKPSDAPVEDKFNAPAPRPGDAPFPPRKDPGSMADVKKKPPRQQPATATSSPRPDIANPEVDEPQEGKPRSSGANGRQVLLESITANEKLVASRMVDGTEAVRSLQQRIDDLRKEGKIDAKFSGRIEIACYDPAVAPPQKVAEASVEIPPAIEPLNCAIQFDRDEYRAGDLVNVDLRVTDSNSQPVAAVLNVQVDAIVPSNSEDSPSPPQYLITSDPSPAVPLVFDNAAEQTQSYGRSLSRRFTEQRQAQRHTALWLLGGSGIGVGLLLVAGLMNWLPKARYWLPVASLLGVTGLLGVIWFPGEQSPPPVPAVTPTPPLTTYGVQSQPPETAKPSGPADATPSELELFRDRPDDHLLAFNESRLAEMSAAQDATADGMTHSLFAMSDWEHLAQAGERREFDDDGTAERIAAGGEPAAGFGLSSLSVPLVRQRDAGPLETSQRQDSADTRAQSSTGQTIYWHPRLTTDTAGSCQVQFVAPPGPQAHRISVIAHNTGRLGTTSAIVPTVVDLQSQK